MNLRDRIRDVVRQEHARPLNEPVLVPVPFDEAAAPSAPAIADALCGAFTETAAGPCFVVEREYRAGTRHGSMYIGEYAGLMAESAASGEVLAAGLPAGEPAAPIPWLFFDLETTGLSGGAGTHAFLVGCGFFDGEVFRTRQLFLTGYAVERAVLTALTGLLAQTGVLVTFNGKSFDVPVIETRYLFHRMALPEAARVHLDMLHPARQFWRRKRDPRAPVRRDALARWHRDPDGDASDGDRCTLGALERSVLDFHRQDDVPGSEIPARYFHFVRSGEAGPLEPVFEHNRLDLVSLAALTARGLSLVAGGHTAAATARECLALGRLYERVARSEPAAACYERSAELSARSIGAPDKHLVWADALRRLAKLHRRERRYAEAATSWEALISTPGCPPAFVAEATEALAVHHEHRSRDLAAARRFARRSVEDSAPAMAREARKRLARVERKLAARAEAGTMLLPADRDER
ncbi:MAG TPA: ribonuclease H-like domain-containing protein [Vicinamibacterales bacterium]